MVDEELQKEVSDIEGTEEPVEEPVEEKAVEEKIEEKPIEEPKEIKKPKSELPQRLISQTKKIGTAFKADKLRSFWQECKRVLRVTKKPDKQEFMVIVKISAIGMGIIGTIGFVIFFAKELLF